MITTVNIPYKELKRALSELRRFKQRGYERVLGVFKDGGRGVFVYDTELCGSLRTFTQPPSNQEVDA